MAIVGSVLLIGFSQTTFAVHDDAYITYRYAKNIVNGKGFVYNPGEHVLGTTTPLYTLLLAAVGILYPDIPTASYAIGVIGWAACSVLVFLICRASDQRITGLIAATLVATSPLFLTALGMETSLYVALSLAAIYLYIVERFNLASIALGLLFLTRGDGILVAFIVLADFLWRRRRFPWQQMFLFALLTVPWLLYSLFTFGSIFPNSLYAKAGQAHKSLLGGEIGSFLYGVGVIARDSLRQSRLHYIFAPLWLAGLVSLARQRPRWSLVMIPWMIVYALAYELLGVLRFPWYYAPLWPGLALLAAEGVACVLALVGQLGETRRWHGWRYMQITGAILLAVVMLSAQMASLAHMRSSTIPPHNQTYISVGNWLRENTPTDATVAAIEIGIIGYYSDRKIIDTMGLITPGMTDHLSDWMQTARYAVLRYLPDYIVGTQRTAWVHLPTEPWFQEMYEAIKDIHNSADPVSPVIIYQKRPNASMTRAFTQEIGLILEDKIALLRSEIESDEVQPSDRVHLILEWEALQETDRDYRVFIDLISNVNGQRWRLADGDPMYGGNPTSLWHKGEIVRDLCSLSVPPDVSLGPFALEVGMYDPITQARLSISDSQGKTIPHIILSPLWIGSKCYSLPYDIQHPVSFNLNNEITFLGYDLPQWTVKPGDVIPLTLYWRAQTDVGQDYTVFTHLVGQDDRIWAQKDEQPVAGKYPTSSWPRGLVIKDKHAIFVQEDVPPGEYQLRVGMYLLQTLWRLPISEADTKQVLDDSIILQSVTVVETYEAIFGDRVQLTGYTLSREKAESLGTKFQITLYWKCLEEMNRDYTIFVYITDAEGQKIVAQVDHEPMPGKYPTSQWRKDERIKESYDFWISPSVPKGRYTIRIGLWLPAEGTRLEVTSSPNPVDSNRVAIGFLDVW